MTFPAASRLPSGADSSGGGELRVELVQGGSAAVSSHAKSPLKILVPRPRGPSVWAYLSSFGGGLVAGDEITLDVTVGDGAKCFLGTQASTKVYRNPRALPCGQNLRAVVGEKSLLICQPEPVQAFAGSRYRQKQEFHIRPDSGLVVVDWLTSGRSARGERWEFSRYESRNEIFAGSKRLALDSLLLDPGDGPIGGDRRMGRHNCLALVVIAGGMLSEQAGKTLETISSLPAREGRGVLVTASPLPGGGALVRIAAENVADARTEIHRMLDFLPRLLEDDPGARRW